MKQRRTSGVMNLNAGLLSHLFPVVFCRADAEYGCRIGGRRTKT